MKYSLALVATLSILLEPNIGHAKKPLFKSEVPIQAVLSAPITQLYRKKRKELRLYMDGTLSYRDSNQTDTKLNVKVRTRGNYRRNNCAHPPLRLNFVQKGNPNTLFEKQNKLKLVGQCKNGARYQELLMLEYLAYKIWEEVSDNHFKTRLIELSYIDTNGKRKPWTSTTFVIEDINDVAKRLNKKVFDVESVKRQQMNLAQTALLELFQLLIGNSDYSTLTGPTGSTCCHNARLIVSKGTKNNVVPIPYDFDVSGFVNAPYAVPAAQYPIKSVRQRYFSGWCKEDRHFTNAIQRFNQHKKQIYLLVQNSNLLSARALTKTLKYLDSYYTQINDSRRVNKEILGRCRGKLIKG